MTTHSSGFLPAPIRMTLNARFILNFEVRLMDGALDVRSLRVVDSTIRIGVARGGGGEWAGGPSPSSMWAADALFLCGS